MGKKVRSRAAAEKVVGNINMLWEILIRVPLKPLVRLKCISKQWQTLISDQQFRDSHSLHHQQRQRYPNSLIFTNYMPGMYYGPSHILSFTTTTTTPTSHVLNLDFLNQSNVIVIRSCNGLLLCRHPKHNDTTYFICNPSTRDFTTLNLCRHPYRKNCGHYLAFEPSISPCYRVISIAVGFNSRLDWVFNVYTFKNRFRIGPAVSVFIPSELDAAKGVYCNGGIHWCNRGEFSVYFDVDTQSLKNYPMPPCDLEWFQGNYYFGESVGRLYLMLPGNSKYSVYDIFELKEDYSGWSLRHRFDLNPIQVEFPHIAWNWVYLSFYIFGMAKDKKKKKSSMSVLIVGREGVISHDPEDKTSKKLCDFEMGTTTYAPIWNSLTFGHVLPHFENLC